jgi:hypothetical protein
VKGVHLVADQLAAHAVIRKYGTKEEQEAALRLSPQQQRDVDWIGVALGTEHLIIRYGGNPGTRDMGWHVLDNAEAVVSMVCRHEAGHALADFCEAALPELGMNAKEFHRAVEAAALDRLREFRGSPVDVLGKDRSWRRSPKEVFAVAVELATGTAADRYRLGKHAPKLAAHMEQLFGVLAEMAGGTDA